MYIRSKRDVRCSRERRDSDQKMHKRESQSEDERETRSSERME